MSALPLGDVASPPSVGFTHHAGWIHSQSRWPFGGTRLHHCMIYGSGMGEGDAHNNSTLPMQLCGRGGETLRPGRHIPACKGNVAMLARAGCPVESFGDGTKAMPDLA